MRGFISIYLGYIKMFIKMRLEYRNVFFSGILANFYCYFILFVSFKILTLRFGDIAGWNFDELTVLYGMNLLSYAFAGTVFWNTALDLEDIIVTGKLDRYLLRPVGVLQQMVLQTFGYTFLGQILVSLIFTLRAYNSLSIFSFGIVLYSIYALVGGIFLQSAAMILFGTLSFWTKKSYVITEVLYNGVSELANYPISIYPKGVRFVLTFILPWALTNYYPCLIILGKNRSTLSVIIGTLAPVIGIVAFGLSVKFFHLGLKHYDGTGS